MFFIQSTLFFAWTGPFPSTHHILGFVESECWNKGPNMYTTKTVLNLILETLEKHMARWNKLKNVW